MVVICPKLFSTNKFHKTTFQINVRPLKNIKPFFFIDFLNLKFYMAHPVPWGMCGPISRPSFEKKSAHFKAGESTNSWNLERFFPKICSQLNRKCLEGARQLSALLVTGRFIETFSSSLRLKILHLYIWSDIKIKFSYN